ncbi:hypothetical protein [Iodidimonas sp. SYSU 1G8]|jgi:hypothetical protein|uniref:hypothetical protein n=1 Tax=Iodidimonas sp. SYSU 1G8 TaxID=3133967 RepID=UPI0031FE4C4B
MNIAQNASCICQNAAIRAYEGLRERGVRDLHAFDAAVTVFRHHHPEVRPEQARHAVAEWIAPDA